MNEPMELLRAEFLCIVPAASVCECLELLLGPRGLCDLKKYKQKPGRTKKAAARSQGLLQMNPIGRPK